MPRDRLNGAHVALQHLAHPEVILGLKVADGHRARAGADGELLLVHRPLDGRRRGGDAKDDEHRLPLALRSLLGPHVGVPVLRRRDDPVGLGRPRDVGDERVVLGEGGDFLPRVGGRRGLFEDDDGVIVGADGQFGAVGVPRVAGDLVVDAGRSRHNSANIPQLLGASRRLYVVHSVTAKRPRRAR